MHQRRGHSGKLSSYQRCVVLQDEGAWHTEGLFRKGGSTEKEIPIDWGFIKALNEMVGHIVPGVKMNKTNIVWPVYFKPSEKKCRMACRTRKVDVEVL